MYWRYFVLATWISSIGTLEVVRLDECDSDSLNCALLDVHININNEIDFPASFNRDLAQQLTSIEIKRSNFMYFPRNLFKVMPNLKSVTAHDCGLVVLNASDFGFASSHNFEDVESLHLEKNYLETLKAYTFSQAKGLTELRLANNRLSSIDASAFYGLLLLSVLDLSSNHLAHLDYDVFLPLFSLERVVLNKNQFKVFNLDIFRGNGKLYDAYIANNNMTQVEAKLVNNVARFFDLSANQLIDISALGKMKGMHTLVLSDNKNIDLGPNTFSEMGHLTQLLLEDIDLRLRLDDDLEFLTPLRKLQILFVARNKLTSLNQFPKLPELRSLVANENEISMLDVYALKRLHPELERLNINNNDWNCQVLKNVLDQMEKLQIELSFHSSIGREEPTVHDTNVNGVFCSNGDPGNNYNETREEIDPEMLVCGRPAQPVSELIYGGQQTLKGAWPWLVAVQKRNGVTVEFVCGGTLISNKLVISAAHCLTDLSIKQALIYIGSHDITNSRETDSQRRDVRQLIIHPDYFRPNKAFSDADIGLIILKLPVDYTDFIKPICLWPADEANQNIVTLKGVVAGWGRDANNPMTRISNAVTMPVVSTTTCLYEDYSFVKLTSNRTLCVGEKNGRGPCHGDSGSGFVMKMAGKWVLRGIVSSALLDPIEGTCDLTNYVILADTVKFMDWILSYLDN